ncbi:hypothetical protein [Fulvivirga sp. M361]|uniref:hypothetical protein n=1 Tax=Fulvivirga sp. M361 TaxID=2594266 RepID=UPI001629C467|nr:hypothetical protein [Fulvivirga sp. M361]
MITFLAVCSITSSTFCQYKNFNTEAAIWHDGEVQLSNGDMRYGQLNYNFIMNIVTLKNDSLETYNPEEVQYFKFKDTLGATLATFYSLPYDIHGTGRQGAVFLRYFLKRGQL